MKSFKNKQCILFVFLFLSAFLPSLSAQTTYFVDKDASGSNNGTSWTNAFTDLQSALDAVSANDIIWVAAGSYVPSKDKSGNASPVNERSKTFQLIDNVKVYGGFKGNESDLADRDISANKTILSGKLASDNVYHVVRSASSSLLDGFVISDGKADGIGSLDTDDAFGGGLISDTINSFSISNCTFYNNTGEQGGGMANLSGGNISVSNCVFQADSASNGGAVGNFGTSVFIENCLFYKNYAQFGVGNTGLGAAIYCWSSGTYTIKNSTIYNNLTTNSGGALHARGADIHITNSIVWGNGQEDFAETLGLAVIPEYCCIEQSGYAGTNGNISADPVFNGAAANTFTLDKSSPCIDAGDGDLAPTTDFRGMERLDYPLVANTGSGTPAYSDIGAYEFWPNDVELSSIISPASHISFNPTASDIIIEFTNTREDSSITSIDIAWTIDDIEQPAYNWTGSLAPGNSSGPVLIGTFAFPEGYSALKIWTEKPNHHADNNTANDTLNLSVYSVGHDIGVKKLVSPELYDPIGTTPFIVTIHNFAPDSTLLDATINWSIDEVLQTPYDWTGTLLPGETSENIEIGTYETVKGSIDIKIWSDAPNGFTDSYHENDTLTTSLFIGSPDPISGTFSIGPSGDFSSFNDAVFMLENAGVDGAVLFNVASGTYFEQVTITEIDGSSSTNTVTFQSLSGDSSDVVLKYAATNPDSSYVLMFDTCSYVRFNNISIVTESHVNLNNIVIINNSSDIEFNNCAFDNLYYYYYTNCIITSVEDKNSANNIAIRNCSFDSGRYGIQLNGKNTGEKSTGLEISGNVFLDQLNGGVKTEYYTNGIINENTVYKSPEYYAFSVNSSSLIEISDNLIDAEPVTGTTDDMRAGITCSSCEYINIKNNTILNFKTYGISIVSGSDGPSATPSTISNNFLSGEGSGIYLFYSPYQYIYHNSVLTKNPGIYVESDHATLINNIFSNRDSNPCIEINTNSTNFTSDYNNFYTTAAVIGTWMGTDCADLAEWQANSSQGSHSISFNPDFISESDLHTYSIHLDGAGMAGLESKDIDGESRDGINPDIGADEYTPEAYNLALIELSLPVSCDLSATEDVQIKIVNAGTSNVDNIPVTYTLDGGTTNVTETIVPQLNSGDTVTYTFTGKADMTMPDLYSCTAFVDYTGDHINSNDTLSQTFYSYGGISSFPFGEDFESGISPYLELTGNSDADVSLDPGSANNSAYGIKFNYSGEGGHFWDWAGGDTPDSTQLWVDNYYFQAFAKSCDIDISSLTNPALQLDMRIVAESYNKRIWFRTLVDDLTGLVDTDGESVYDFSDRGSYTTKTYLLDQVGSDYFKITFQSCMLETAPAVYIDNIKIGEKPIVNAGSDAVVCDGEFASFDATTATGDQYFWFAEGNTDDTLSKAASINIGVSGTYYVDVYSTAGIKTSDTVKVLVNPRYFFQEADEICEDESVLWHGEIFTSSDVYYDSLLSVNGCDSVYEFTLVVHPEYYFTENESICDTDSVLWHGNYYKETGSYYDSLFSMNGCDSVYQFDLLVNTSYFYTQSEEICASESFSWRGDTYNISDTYYDSMLTINGCDSVYELKLTVHPEYFYSQEETLCSGDSILWQDVYYKAAGTYTENYSSINGCDSIYELILTVNPSYFYTEEHEICSNESFSWQGNDYSSTGTFYANYTTVDGCDSIYELNLIVNPAFEYNETATICDGDSILWHGTYYKEEGTYTDNHTSVAGCDSTYTMELAVALHYYYYESDNMCPGSYVSWHGKFLNSPGVYYDSLTTIYGCDSIYEFHLDTTRAYHFVEEMDICIGDYIFWQGSQLSSTGTYFKNFTTKAGCDSIFEMRLTVHWGYDSPTDYQTICEGDSLLWRDSYYKEAGDYYDSLLTKIGCDSIFSMNLEIRPAPADFIIEQTSDEIYTDEAVVIYLSYGESTTQYTWEVEEGYINYNNNMEMEVVWSDTGTYKVAVYGTTQQGCTGDTRVHEAVVTYRDDGINDNRFDNRLRIYPNPVKDKLNIVYPEEILVELYDLTGRELLISSKNEVDLSVLLSGTYIVKIKDSRDRLIYIEKLIKQ